MPSTLRVAAALTAVAVPLMAQAPMSDSVMKLNRAGRWEHAADLARTALGGPASLDERCALRVGSIVAFTRLGAYEIAGREVKALDDQCAGNAVVRQQASELRPVRDRLALPPLPKTGLDFAAVDQFWKIADLLANDVSPSEDQWHAMLSTVGYRLSMMNVPTTRSDLEIALRPSRRAERDTLVSKQNDRAARLKHLAAAAGRRSELARYRDSVTRALPVREAIALAGRFLPPGATDGVEPVLVAFALFRGDAYSLGALGVIIDLYHVYEEGGLTLLLAHEFHHSYLSALSKVQRPPAEHPAATLVNALINMRNEGIADLIDKPYPLSYRTEVMAAYAKRYNEAYARTPAVIRSIDSALVVAADDSTQLRAVGSRVQALLPSAGHYNGSYVAREIYETFGVDSLFPGVRNPFAFLRTYAAAEKKRGNPAPFSTRAVALLDALEKRYLTP